MRGVVTCLLLAVEEEAGKVWWVKAGRRVVRGV